MEHQALTDQWRWVWEDLCGKEGFVIWSPQRHDFGLCFQQLSLHIPALFLLAISSAYYCGKHDNFVIRAKLQKLAVTSRCYVALLLTFLPLIQIYMDQYRANVRIQWIAYFLSAAQGIAWFTHFMYIRALRKRLCKSPRGPIFVCIVWSVLFALNVVSVRSHYLVYKYSFDSDYSIYLAYKFSICHLVAHLMYAFTMMPGEGNAEYVHPSVYRQMNENTPLLSGNAYVRFSEEGDPGYLGVAMEDAHWLSRLCFCWVNPLMQKGVEKSLKNCDDLFDLPESLNSTHISFRLAEELALDDGADTELRADISLAEFPNVRFMQSRQKTTSLLRGLHRCFWAQFYSIGILKFIADCAGFAGPMLLNKLVSFIENKDQDVKYGYIFAAGLVATTAISALCDTHFNFRMALVGIRMRAALITAIYGKTLSVRSSLLTAQFSVGEIVNFMSTDTDRIVNSCPSFHALWSIPFQLGVTLYLLYTQVGLAFLAGLVFSILLIPINKMIANKIGQLSTKLMEQKDARVKIITEVLRGIRAVKLYVWEQHFIRLITKLRDQELKYLKGRKYLDALCVYFWAATPVIISILTFGVYSLTGHRLTAATVFTGMALLNMLIGPLNAFPWVLNGVTEAWVSIKRLQKLFDLPNLDLDTFYDKPPEENCDILVESGGFSWCKQLSTAEKAQLHALQGKNNERGSAKGKGKGKRSALTVDKRKTVEKHVVEEGDAGVFRLTGLGLKIRKGEFVGIIGPVGSGKSSLLCALMGDLPLHAGNVAISQIESGFGYVPQKVWLQRGTIRENILFGRPYEDSRYKAVLDACGLSEDIKNLPAGDMTGVGDSGSTLSGGQKTRVALARAVYQDKSVYLLDDILSAVDPKVARHIFQYCIMGLLSNKTRILCTHHVKYLVYADRIGLLENGAIKSIGKPADVLGEFDDSLQIDLELDDSNSLSNSPSITNSLMETTPPDTQMEEIVNDDDVLSEEHSEKGSLEFGVYASYWRAAGHILSICVLISVTVMQFSRNMTDWWLAHWVTDSDINNATNSTNYTILLDREILMSPASLYDEEMHSYLKIYIELACLNSLFTLLRAFLFAYGGVVAAAKFHKLLLKSVVKVRHNSRYNQ
ncbi:unnamed protein product [Acanthoscelides obtectus]|uniref:ABC-type xenobiotic transporter n=1 Tax=Acanthoscelides obtectus TaxID=200917 RepID=A0A9P0JSL9_ACAOB|nr:unnamed protein product [Acanthoscelides obtectus]CAK1665844.1 Multidrug resistance-associated protein 7 [Acanthoscelides obtectus]